MKDKFMIPLLSIGLLFVFSCGDAPKGESLKPEQEIRSQEEYGHDKEITNKAFDALVSRFQIKELPLLGTLHAKEFDIFDYSKLTLKERYEKKRIPIDTAVKYFFKGDKELNKQPSGGIYEHYYGYRFSSNGDYVLLFYYRPSDDTYFYRVATFDFEGNLIDDLGVGGQLGEEAQKEFLITEDLKIETQEISFDISTYSDSLGVEAYQVNEYYQIKPTGKIELIRKDEIGQVTYIEDENSGYFRLVPKN